MVETAFQPTEDRSSPLHSWFSPHADGGDDDGLCQFRAKVQRYSGMPSEITIQRVSFDREMRSYREAWLNSQNAVNRPNKRVSDGKQSEESLERAMFRAKTQVRKLVTELAPSALVTFTTREILSFEGLLWVWQHFTRTLRSSGLDFDYVAVPERHPKNPDHLHLHVAYRGKTHFNTLRRLWHMALEARHGRRVSVVLRGAAAPGNVDVQPIKSRDQLGRVRKVAKYVSKYITKDLISEFNRKRYWPSKGINVAAAQVFWLDAQTQSGAILEAMTMFGQVDDGIVMQRFWRPSERVAWCALNPAATPPPPF